MVVQFLFNGLVLASIIVLGALGINLLYGVKKFANFAHGDLMTLGAYLTLLGAQRAQDIVGAAAVAVAGVALVGLAQEFLIYAHLEGRGPVAPLVASVGVALVLQNSISAYFGPSIVTYGLLYPDNWVVAGGVISANPLRDLVPLAVGFGITIAALLLLRVTKLGKALRATADNRDLARVSGVNTRFVNAMTWVLVAVLASIGGSLTGLTAGTLSPQIGATLLLTMFAAVIVGGIGSPFGAVVGSVVVGLSQSMFFALSLATGIDPRWQTAVPFALLVIVLLVRPMGIMGRQIGGEIRPLRTEIIEMLASLRRGLFKR